MPHGVSIARNKILSRWKHAAAQTLFAAGLAYLLRPVHPAVLAQAEKVPRVFIRSEPQIVEAKQHHARSPVRPLKRRFSGQSEIRHPLLQSCAVVGPPQELPRVLPVQRGNAAFCLQHFARAAVNFQQTSKASSGLTLITPPHRPRHDSPSNRLQRNFPLPLCARALTSFLRIARLI